MTKGRTPSEAQGDNVGKAARTVVVMGPSGCGKSTVGRRLAELHGATFIDADAHHPLTNVEKMQAGVPLTDEDRIPWLETLADMIWAAAAPERQVLACSALKEDYRRRLGRGESGIFFACLIVPREELARRLRTRPSHFFNPRLLDSQLAALEVPEGGAVDGTAPLDVVVAQIARRACW